LGATITRKGRTVLLTRVLNALKQLPQPLLALQLIETLHQRVTYHDLPHESRAIASQEQVSVRLPFYGA
jgi:hypothetical protein